MVALHFLAAGDVEEDLLLGGLDALGRDGKAQRMAKRKHGGDDRAGLGCFTEVLDEAPVDLDLVDLELAKVAQ